MFFIDISILYFGKKKKKNKSSYYKINRMTYRINQLI